MKTKTKKTKLTRGQKAWRTRKKNAAKHTLKTVLAVTLISLILSGVMPTQAQTPLRENYDKLPQSKNKEYLNIWERIDQILLREDAWGMREQIRCTLWRESISTYGDKSDLAYNAQGNSPAHSLDRGACMFNSYWRKDVSNEQAFSLDSCLPIMIKNFKQKRQREWYGYRRCQTDKFKF